MSQKDFTINRETSICYLNNQDNVYVFDAYGGIAEEYNWDVSTYGATVLGFSMEANFIPAGCGTLTYLNADGDITGVVESNQAGPFWSGPSGAVLDILYISLDMPNVPLFETLLYLLSAFW